MNQEVKAKWIAALESGEWVCVKEKMAEEDTNGRCCLGVLTEVYFKENGISPDNVRYDGMSIYWDITPSPDPEYDDEWGADSQSFEDQVDPKIAKWAGLDDEIQSELAAANDARGEYPIDRIREL